ncbi:ferrous iron transport protein B [Candidatus Bipolaricaulota bacterium]|nr:ferrous iron transport protein B [Candidatus Bipolaricaulota bacterium]
MRIALVGQPNSGKSTLFNALVGLRAVASNFPGTTVEILRGRTFVAGKPAEIVDLPGIYSLHAQDPAERVAREFLLHEKVDLIINVVDSSVLLRSLSLTLELAELGIPMVVVLNMADEAEHKGLRIEKEKLAEILGVPVVFTVASRGIGLKELLSAIPAARVPKTPSYSPMLEEALTELVPIAQKDQRYAHLPGRTAAVFFLAEGEDLPEAVHRKLLFGTDRSGAMILADERAALAARIFREVARVERTKPSLREHLDDVLMHPVLGYPFLILALFLLFFLTFKVGGALEGLLLPPLEELSEKVRELLGGGVFPQALAGALDGLFAGIAIALPYLLPFYLFLALLEDVGYLPRLGFLLDGFMHRLGLHGKSVVPFVLGYGCSVPAVLATRILEDERDRLITAALAVMIPCAARTVVIFGLVGRFLGPLVALGLYLLNILVVALAATILARVFPATGPGLIMEIPPYRWPAPRATLGKTWLRLREFVKVAWPILMVSSFVLALVEALGWQPYLNAAARIFTWPLGLPAQAGVPLIFGVLRKELALLLLAQAMGNENFAAVLSPGQMITFTVFTIFYVPCLATVAVLLRELGKRRTILVILGTTGLALLLGLLVRLLSFAF